MPACSISRLSTHLQGYLEVWLSKKNNVLIIHHCCLVVIELTSLKTSPSLSRRLVQINTNLEKLRGCIGRLKKRHVFFCKMKWVTLSSEEAIQYSRPSRVLIMSIKRRTAYYTAIVSKVTQKVCFHVLVEGLIISFSLVILQLWKSCRWLKTNVLWCKALPYYIICCFHSMKTMLCQRTSDPVATKVLFGIIISIFLWGLRRDAKTPGGSVSTMRGID